jgi:hypothetical protein
MVAVSPLGMHGLSVTTGITPVDQFPGVSQFPLAALNVIVQATAANAVPVPVSMTLCGLPAALSVMLRLVDSAPVLEGVKMYWTVQFPPAPMLMGSAAQVPPPATWAKSLALPPPRSSPVITSDPVPGFESVRFSGVLLVRCV